MMGHNRKRLTNRPRYNPRIESPDFFLTNSASSPSFESTSTLLKNGNQDCGNSTKKQRGRKEAIPAGHRIRNRTSDPASRQKDAIATYISRYVTSAPENAKRPNEDDEITTGPRVRLTDNVKIVFDEERYRKSLATTPRTESSISIRNFSSIHHIADHKRNVCNETFRKRFTKPEARKYDLKFDAKRVLSEGMELGNAEENDDGKVILISKALGNLSDEFGNNDTNGLSKGLHPMTKQDEHVKNLLNRMMDSNTDVARAGKKNDLNSRGNLFRVNGMRLSANNTNYVEFAKDFSEFPQPNAIEETANMNRITSINTGIPDCRHTRHESIIPDDNKISSMQYHKPDSSSSKSPYQIVKSNVKSEMVIRSDGITSIVDENKSGNGSEPSLRIAVRIPSAVDTVVAGDRSSGHLVVQTDSGMSSAVSDSIITKDDPCFACPFCVAQREMEEKQKRIKDKSFNQPDSLRAAAEEEMDFRSSRLFDSRPSLPSCIPERVELKHVEAYHITPLSDSSRRHSDHGGDDESKERKAEYRLSLKDVRKEKSSTTSPTSPKSNGNSLHLQGTELQPQDRFSFVSESPIAGFPAGLGKQYPVPEFRPSPIYSSKWVVEKSSLSRSSFSSNTPDIHHPFRNGNISGMMPGVSVPCTDSIENEVLNMRIPFLIWRNKQKKEGIASIKDNRRGNTITLNHRSGKDLTVSAKNLTLAQQALLTQRMESDRKTAFPCPPNSPAPGQLVDLVQDLHEGSEESLSQSHLRDLTLANDIQV